MQPNEIVTKAPASKIFGSLSEAQRDGLISASATLSFMGGEEASERIHGCIAVVLRGGAEVYSADGGRKTLIRLLGEGDLFGVAGLFSGSENISRIITKSRTQLLMIPKTKIASLLSENSTFASDYVSFLERRIAFLNNRIYAFTAGSCERKLALFLCSISGEESFSLSISFSSLAKQLDMGRASFYRALGILEEAGLVSGYEKQITVHSRSALKAKYV